MVNVFAGPVQLTDPLVKVGVTVIVAEIGVVPLFMAINEIFPVLLAASPIPVLLLVQEYVVDPTVLLVVKFMEVFAPLHTTWLAGWITCPEGFTVIINVFEGPVQLTAPLVNEGVTVMVAIIGAVPALVAVKGKISPLPLAASPMEMLLFDQE